MKQRIMKTKLCLLLLCMILTLPSLFYTKDSATAHLNIIYTGSLNGNLDGCMCAGHPKAGLVKSSAYISTFKDRKNILLLDTGDLLDSQPDDLMADEIFGAYKALKYDAIAIGENDFANGTETLIKSTKLLPFISQNLPLSDVNPVKSPIILQKAGIKIGVFSLTSPLTFEKSPLKDNIKFVPEEETAKDTVNQLKAEKVELIILIYHGAYANLNSLLAKVKGIDVALFGHETNAIDAEDHAGTIIAAAGSDGNSVGNLELTITKKQISGFTNSFRIFNYKSDPDEAFVRKRVNSYEDKMIQRLKSGDIK